MKHIFRIGLMVFLCFGCLRAQSPSQFVSASAGKERIYDLGGGSAGNGIVPPRLVSKLDTHSAPPPTLRPHGKFNGTTIVAMVIDTSGQPRDVRVVRSAGADAGKDEQWLGTELDQAAVKRMQALLFEPATLHGRAVNVRVRISTTWRMREAR